MRQGTEEPIRFEDILCIDDDPNPDPEEEKEKRPSDLRKEESEAGEITKKREDKKSWNRWQVWTKIFAEPNTRSAFSATT
ncbi:hypothetical protein GCK32_019737 [Trichostrongylus colubriformis]|uniref:Uncharacterized protein n=1 Tax=Trichostrongylus colubriformis TaxID=6319 RepID=A0AAN8IKF7_TRICO